VKRKLYGCPGCGDPTTGSLSESTGTEYDCCPSCIDRATESIADMDDPDKGPWRLRAPLRRCPKCRGTSSVSIEGNGLLECDDCQHMWQPRGVYVTKRQERKAIAGGAA
jgi:hypothetical protein